ncbi:MAG: uracil-DNA glycosylase [Thermoplasmata archaeon]
MTDTWASLRSEVLGCRACPRLVAYREQIARTRKREFRNEEYWGRPVFGFGDPHARLILVGLAPAAHGSNRTGRMFTGDRSAAFLVDALYAAGFANQPTSRYRGDGLRYTDLYMTAAVRCVPPDNRPTAEERHRCLSFLIRELRALPETRAVLALGGVAWEALLASSRAVYGVEPRAVPFRHGACVALGPGRPLLWASYHPSPQNTNTGKLSRSEMIALLHQIREGYRGGTDSADRPTASGGRGGRIIPSAPSRPQA